MSAVKMLPPSLQPQRGKGGRLLRRPQRAYAAASVVEFLIAVLRLMGTATFRALGMIQQVARDDGIGLRTLRVPLRIEGQYPQGNERAAPLVGQHSERLFEEFGLRDS